MKRLDQYWYSKNLVATSLVPLSWVFRGIAATRRWLFSMGILSRQRLPVPVIVVGNITVGGTGKTPLVIWLANFLREQGYRPGIISRGYGGQARNWPQQVRTDSDPKAIGDEAIVIARRAGCPMAVGPDRVATARSLLSHHDIDILISDDGMQHYKLARDMEVAVIDGVRRLGNGYFLPAGPLREGRERLQSVDLIIANGIAGPGEYLMKVEKQKLHQVNNPGNTMEVKELAGKAVHAMAAIGHPERFFKLLSKEGLQLTRHEFADHYFFKQEDIQFGDQNPVIMTEKDAVKCTPAPGDHYWYLAISVVPDDRFSAMLLDKLNHIAGIKKNIDKNRQELTRLRVNG